MMLTDQLVFDNNVMKEEINKNKNKKNKSVHFPSRTSSDKEPLSKCCLSFACNVYCTAQLYYFYKYLIRIPMCKTLFLLYALTPNQQMCTVGFLFFCTVLFVIWGQVE